MIPDNTGYVIVHNDRHGSAAYACTVENALKLVNEAAAEYGSIEGVYEDYVKQKEGQALRPISWLTEALKEVLNLSEGSPMRRMRIMFYGARPRDGEDLRPEALFDKEWQRALVLWCFEHKVDLATCSTNELLSHNPMATLPFLAPAVARFPRGLKLVDDLYYDAAEELHVLRKNSWKETASTLNVVGRYLRFLNTWSGMYWDTLRVIDKA